MAKQTGLGENEFNLSVIKSDLVKKEKKEKLKWAPFPYFVSSRLNFAPSLLTLPPIPVGTVMGLGMGMHVVSPKLILSAAPSPAPLWALLLLRSGQGMEKCLQL